MPLYEYRCASCGGACEILVRSADEKPACPACGSKKLSKQFSTFAAAVAGPALPSCASGACATGACSTGGCSTGACPFN
ncbi:MAG: zinc ribbon domain-containing protein [Lentisphaerae bacterium]|nr:zinc ribbon domain-containing protein [Lentisphaerota bacterium]